MSFSRRAPRGRRALILAATAAVFLSACGGGDSSAEDEPAGNPNDPRNSPLAQLMGWSGDSAEQRARELEVQQAMAQCMQDEGWEYEPVDWQAQMGDMSAEWELQMSDPEAYGEKYGYGVVRSYESQGEMQSNTFEDPNQDYLNSLTPDESEAYYETLYGKQSFSEGDGEEFTMPPLEEQGCSGKATLVVYGENSAMTNTDVQNRVNESYEQIQNDPDVVAALDTWSACMRDKDPSYDWESPDEATSSFWDRLNELQGYGSMSEDGSMTAATVAVDPSTGMPELDEADLEELRQDEIDTWRDDWDCQQEADIAEVRMQAEQRFVDDLLAEFPELGES